MAGGIEQIDAMTVVVELQHGGADRDAAFFFQLHPVGSRGPLVLAGRDRTGQLHGTAIQQEFLRQRGFAGVRVGNNRKGAASGNLGLHERGMSHSRILADDDFMNSAECRFRLHYLAVSLAKRV